ncbi:pentapeptide repeat-containing protein [Streptomyces sp. NPDC057740]|uniref:pentapeptide repeat-containing protein n=1 Tax=Streptomyces sp. NPDC057740 TaxID=3346234 RepID=UPI0036739DFB
MSHDRRRSAVPAARCRSCCVRRPRAEPRCRFSKASLGGPTEADLCEANLRKADAGGAVFHRADLRLAEGPRPRAPAPAPAPGITPRHPSLRSPL